MTWIMYDNVMRLHNLSISKLRKEPNGRWVLNGGALINHSESLFEHSVNGSLLILSLLHLYKHIHANWSSKCQYQVRISV